MSKIKNEDEQENYMYWASSGHIANTELLLKNLPLMVRTSKGPLHKL